ncbi:tail length tape measure protein [Fictibacillus macauensis ZFHKF-1]|uniref:Tail length tape measure protein n=1 Tax=Fictibacillus macauensis ZFHKF-1 TaxID=1196324 RepID=I8AK25_9BACL|nr:peptidoglycan DD-metalloendopeptidase family protein [Fictibacillus macauensis]EIT85904.1 tail length tape measure protein [Fictibacillus macauensis ZFHKF-1]
MAQGQNGNPIGNMIINLSMNGSQFQNTLDNINQQVRLAESAMKANLRTLGDAEKSYGGLASHAENLERVMEAQRRKMDELNRKHQDAVRVHGESSRQAQKLAEQINRNVVTYSNYERQLNSTRREMIYASEGVNELTNEMRDIERETANSSRALRSAGDVMGSYQRQLDGITRQTQLSERAIEAQRRVVQRMNDEFGETDSRTANARESLARLERQFEELSTQGIAVRNSMTQVNDSTEEAGSRFEALRGRIGKIGLALTAAFTVPLAAITKIGVEVSNMVSDAELKITGLMNTTKDSAKKISRDITQAYAKVYSDSPEQGAEARAGVQAQTGLKGKKAQDVANMTYVIAQATGYEQEQIIATLNTFMKKYDLSANQAYDELLRLREAGVTELDEIREYLPLMKDMGITTSQFTGAIAAGIQEGGWNADKVQDFIKEGAIRINSEDKKTYSAVGLGKEFKQFQNKKIDYTEFLGKAQEKAKGKSVTKQKQMWAAVSGTQGEDIDLDTINATVSGLKKGKKIESGKSGDLKEQYDSKPMVQFTKATRELQVALKPLGDTLLQLGTSILEKVSPYIKSFSEWFAKLGDGSKIAILAFTGIAASMAPLGIAFSIVGKGVKSFFGIFGKIFGLFSRSEEGTSRMSRAMSRLGGVFGRIRGVASSAFSGIARGATGAIRAMGSGFSRATGVLRSFGSQIARVGSLMGRGFLATVRGLGRGLSMFSGVLSKVAGVIGKGLVTALRLAAVGFKILGRAMFMNPIGLIITGIIALVAGFRLAYKHSETFRAIVDKLWGAIKKGLKWVKDFGSAIVSLFKGDNNKGAKLLAKIGLTPETINKIQTAVRLIKEQFKGMINGIKKIFSGIKQVFTGFVQGDMTKVWQGIKTIFSGAISAIRSTIAYKFIAYIVKAIGGFVSNVIGKIKSLWSRIKNFFSDGISNVISGIGRFAGNMISKFGDLKNRAIDKFRDMVDYVKKVPGKMADGLAKGKDALVDGAKKLGNGLISGIEWGVNKAIGGVNWVLDKLGSDTRISKWEAPHFKNGTPQGGHKGGLAVVGDGGEHELIVLPNGKMGLSPNKDTLVNLPKGTEVVSGKKTKQLFGGGKPSDYIPAFKDGTGGMWSKAAEAAKGAYHKVKDWGSGIWDWVKDKASIGKLLINRIAESGFGRMATVPLSMAKGAVVQAVDAGKSYLYKIAQGLMGGSENGGYAAMVGSSHGRGFGPAFRKTSNYGMRWGRLHKGHDYGAMIGTPIPSQSAGTVIYSGYGVSGSGYGGYGNVVHVAAGGGMSYLYGHMSRRGVMTGQRVSLGQYLGAVGSTGNSTGPHLHFETRRNGVAFSPSAMGYAKGGFINKEHMAMVGEGNKREVVIPLERYKERAKALWVQAGKQLGILNENKNRSVGLQRLNNYRGTSSTPVADQRDTALLAKQLMLMQQQVDALAESNKLLTQILLKDTSVYLDSKEIHDSNKHYASKEKFKRNLATGII